MANSVGSNDNTSGSKLRDLLSKALTGPLPPAQHQQFLAELATTDPKLLLQHGLITPAKLPDLVENNTAVAADVLIKLAAESSDSSLIEYLDVLRTMNTSPCSMEVAHRLITRDVFPKEFILAYVTSRIVDCLKTKDHRMQCRLVRLVSVFLEALIEQRFIEVTDILEEAEVFCITFPRIREAAELYMLLKGPSE